MRESNSLSEPSSSITLPLKILANLLFSSYSAEYEAIKPISPKLGDYARPKIIPIELGELILKLDPTPEKYFHVFIVTNNQDYGNIHSWAELWEKFQWDTSNARHYYSKEASDRRIQEWEEQRTRRKSREELIEEIEATLAINPTWRGLSDPRRRLAISIADNYQKHDLTNILKTLDLYETVQEYEQRNNGT